MLIVVCLLSVADLHVAKRCQFHCCTKSPAAVSRVSVGSLMQSTLKGTKLPCALQDPEVQDKKKKARSNAEPANQSRKQARTCCQAFTDKPDQITSSLAVKSAPGCMAFTFLLPMPMLIATAVPMVVVMS